jgi:UDP-N-acetylglucosamine 2-epimerase (non-hydrolysing)
MITGHRRENFGSGFLNICNAIAALAERHRDWQFIYPVHLNPNVQEPVYAILSNIPNIHLIPPLEYAPFVFLMNKARIILTDSGGVQEEGPTLGKPVIVMRDVTERPEAVESGTALLVGTNYEKIISETESLMIDSARYNSMAKTCNPYGDGFASERIDKYLSAVLLAVC